MRLVKFQDPNTAIGAAARLMMDDPVFARRGFGEWARALDGQARRDHQRFVINEEMRLVGFIGFALASESIAEDWLAGRRSPASAECLEGDCVIFNAIIASESRVSRFLYSCCRELAYDKKAVFFKRIYSSGAVRSVRIDVTEAVRARVRSKIRSTAPKSQHELTKKDQHNGPDCHYA